MSAAQRERAALVETMRTTDPGAPTLCEGWDARDLAAHLVIREYRLDAAAGIAIPFFAGRTDKIQERVAQHTEWDRLLDKIASGPPVYSPFKLLDPVANLAEMFIHHEDVRRARPDWEPRELDDATVKGLTRTLSLFSRLTLAKVPVRVALRSSAGKTLVTAGKGDPVTVTGRPEELLLFSAGRAARVDLDGDPRAVQALQDAPKGL
jgi:uncharacterized protein (TIGR03085 family)